MYTKERIRRTNIERRAAMSPELVHLLGESIRTHLNASPLITAAPEILCHVSKDNEVPTHAFIRDCLAREQRVFAPAIRPGGAMDWRALHRWEDLRPGAFGILEPAAPLQGAPPPRSAICLIPCVVLRSDGHRIGYGKGHFDRFLANHPGITMALAYDFQVSNDWAQEGHDIPLRFICTESGIRPAAGRSD